jgi:hypothetical protein
MAILLKRHHVDLWRSSFAGRFLGRMPKKKRITSKGLTSSSYKPRIKWWIVRR